MSTETEKNPILIDLPMPVETPRLILRPVMPGDGAEIERAQGETWDQLSRWMPWASARKTPAEQELWARQAYAKFILREDLAMVGLEKASGRPVIWTGLHRIDWDSRQFEIGYWVRKSAQGNGYAGESTNALARYAFNVLAARRVNIGHAAGNEPSRRTIEKLGFQKEGVRRQSALLPDGSIDDGVVYGLLSPDVLPPLSVKWGPP